MKNYMKAFLSFLIGLVCIGIGLGMETDNKMIPYFLYIVGIVNLSIGAKDVVAILQKFKE